MEQATSERLKKRRVSSGIAQFDSLLGDLFIGDNVLWYEDAAAFRRFCLHFIRESLARKQPRSTSPSTARRKMSCPFSERWRKART